MLVDTPFSIFLPFACFMSFSEKLGNTWKCPKRSFLPAGCMQSTHLQVKTLNKHWFNRPLSAVRKYFFYFFSRLRVSRVSCCLLSIQTFPGRPCSRACSCSCTTPSTPRSRSLSTDSQSKHFLKRFLSNIQVNKFAIRLGRFALTIYCLCFDPPKENLYK